MPYQNQTFMSRLLKSASLFGIKRQFIFPTWIKRFFGSRVICSIIELSALDPVQRSMTSAQIMETSVKKNKKESALRKHWECSYPCTLCALFGSRLW